MLKGCILSCLLGTLIIVPAMGQNSLTDDRLDNWDASSLADDRESGELVTDAQALDKAHSAFMRDMSLQKERPVDLEKPEFPEFEPREIRSPSPINLSWLAPIMKVLFWGIVGIIAIWALYGLVRLFLNRSDQDRELKKRNKRGQADDVYVDVRPEAAAAKTLLEEAERLAREGRFAEAVHLLLFRSIEDIQKRLEGGVPKSLTAREIGSLPAIPETAQSALSPIIMIVEASFFGNRDVTESNWLEAKSSYERFAFGGVRA